MESRKRCNYHISAIPPVELFRISDTEADSANKVKSFFATVDSKLATIIIQENIDPMHLKNHFTIFFNGYCK